VIAAAVERLGVSAPSGVPVPPQVIEPAAGGRDSSAGGRDSGAGGRDSGAGGRDSGAGGRDSGEPPSWRVAGLGHDLNNALACVFCELSFLAEGLEAVRRAFASNGIELAPVLDECLASVRSIDDAARAANDCGRELQALGRGRASPPARPRADLRAAAERSLRLCAASLRGVDVTFEVTAAAVAVSEETLVRVLVNLVTNAWQAFPSDQVERRLEVRAFVLAGAVVCEVVDNGPGVAPEILPRLFQRFATTKAERRGTGIGLATSRELVRAAGGELALAATSARGSVFRLTLPFA
jgi:signal transduction histidine kinase